MLALSKVAAPFVSFSLVAKGSSQLPGLHHQWHYRVVGDGARYQDRSARPIEHQGETTRVGRVLTDRVTDQGTFTTWTKDGVNR